MCELFSNLFDIVVAAVVVQTTLSTSKPLLFLSSRDLLVLTMSLSLGGWGLVSLRNPFTDLLSMISGRGDLRSFLCFIVFCIVSLVLGICSITPLQFACSHMFNNSLPHESVGKLVSCISHRAILSPSPQPLGRPLRRCFLSRCPSPAAAQVAPTFFPLFDPSLGLSTHPQTCFPQLRHLHDCCNGSPLKTKLSGQRRRMGNI